MNLFVRAVWLYRNTSSGHEGVQVRVSITWTMRIEPGLCRCTFKHLRHCVLSGVLLKNVSLSVWSLVILFLLLLVFQANLAQSTMEKQCLNLLSCHRYTRLHFLRLNVQTDSEDQFAQL